MYEYNNPYELVSVAEAANLLQVSRTKMYSILRQGGLKNFRVGSHYKIPRAAVDEYIARMSGLAVPTHK